jgi:predicted transcriptional regulator
MAKAPSTPTCGAGPEQVIDHIRRISTLEAAIRTLKEDTDEIKETVHRIDKALRGNNTAGLMARTASLEDSRDEHEEAQKSDRRWRRGILAAVIVALIGAGVQLALG